MKRNDGLTVNIHEGRRTFIPKKEMWLYGVAALGQGMMYAAMSSYVSDFYLNVLKLSPIFVMLLMLFARIWDAVNDPMMGMIVDRCDSKRGKYKPYIIYTVAPIALFTFLMFYMPKFADPDRAGYNESGVCAWVAIIYVLWGMIYTTSDVPFWSLPNAMTPNAEERGKTISLARTLNGVGSAVPMAIYMILGFMEIPDRTKYLVMAIVASVCGGLLFTASYFTSKERIKIPRPVVTEKKENVLKLIFKNKYLMLVVLMGVLSSGRYMLQAAAVHVSRYSFYIEGLSVAKSQSTVQLIFSICTAVGMFGAMLACPFLIKKISYKKLVVISCAVGGAAGLIGYVVGLFTSYNVWAFIPFLVMSSLPLGVLNVVSYAMIGDCLDYMELETGRRETGLGSACQSFVNKLGNALATTMIIAMYSIVNLDVKDITSKTVELVNPTTLPNSVRHGMYMLVTLIPAVCLLLCMIPMFFYKLTGKTKEDMLLRLEEARKARGIKVSEGEDEPEDFTELGKEEMEEAAQAAATEFEAEDNENSK